MFEISRLCNLPLEWPVAEELSQRLELALLALNGSEC